MARKIRQLKIYLRYQKKIYQFFWYRLNYDPDISEDLCSEVFFQMLKNWEDFDQNKPAYPWICGIARNIYCNHLRSLGREARLEDYPEQYKEEEEDWINRLELEKALSALDKLPDALRDIILLRHLEGLSYREISEILNCREGALRAQLCRARKKLKDNLRYG